MYKALIEWFSWLTKEN